MEKNTLSSLIINLEESLPDMNMMIIMFMADYIYYLTPYLPDNISSTTISNKLINYYQNHMPHYHDEYYLYKEFTDITNPGFITPNGTGHMATIYMNNLIVDLVYHAKYEQPFIMKKYSSEELNMMPGIDIYSELSDHHAIDYLMNLFLESISISKEEFIHLSYQDNKAKYHCLNRVTMTNLNEELDSIYYYMDYISAVDKFIRDGNILNANNEVIPITYGNTTYYLNYKINAEKYQRLVEYFKEHQPSYSKKR